MYFHKSGYDIQENILLERRSFHTNFITFASLNTNLPNWIIGCPNGCYRWAVLVFSQNWPNEDPRNHKSTKYSRSHLISCPLTPLGQGKSRAPAQPSVSPPQ